MLFGCQRGQIYFCFQRLSEGRRGMWATGTGPVIGGPGGGAWLGRDRNCDRGDRDCETCDRRVLGMPLRDEILRISPQDDRGLGGVVGPPPPPAWRGRIEEGVGGAGDFVGGDPLPASSWRAGGGGCLGQCAGRAASGADALRGNGRRGGYAGPSRRDPWGSRLRMTGSVGG